MSIVARLRFPTGGETVHEREDGVECSACHRRRMVAGYLDCSASLSAGGTTSHPWSFGFEWNSFDDVRVDNEDFTDIYFRGSDLVGWQGKVGLDAGCESLPSGQRRFFVPSRCNSPTGRSSC
jgi:hypothetical protein